MIVRSLQVTVTLEANHHPIVLRLPQAPAQCAAVQPCTCLSPAPDSLLCIQVTSKFLQSIQSRQGA